MKIVHKDFEKSKSTTGGKAYNPDAAYQQTYKRSPNPELEMYNPLIRTQYTIPDIDARHRSRMAM
jgi:hypothetical protein